MKGVGVILLLGVFSGWSSAVFLNHRPFPTYSLEEMPKTQFSCREKILGGYYADPEAQCQMFHICVKVAGVGIQDFRFLCPNGTAFDQDHQICADWEDVDCDATTLYYSSDNFDLYRVGSGFESKSFKYGEDEDVYALQRAETGDIRLNKEHQVQSVNQQKDPYQRPPKKINFNNNNNNRNNVNTNYNSNNSNYNNRNNNNKNDDEREIFQKSSSSNFFNNRNNGKENDEDYDDNVNVNQNEDFEQKRKVARKQQRRPIQQQQQNNFNRPQETTTTSTTVAPVQKTRRPHQRPTGFVNNFAGSSYVPTTKASTTSEQQPTTSNYNNNFRRAGNNVQRRPTTTNNNNVNYQQTNTQNNQNFNSPTPSYTISTPAPFSRQNTQAQNLNNKPTTFNTNQYTSNQFKNSNQFQSTTARLTENYPTQKPSTQSINFNTNYDFPKQSKTENYPSNNPQYSKTTNDNFNTPSYTPFDKKPTGLNYKPTTFSPKAKPFSVVNTQPQNTNVNDAFPTTFSPRTNQAFNQVAQQTQSFNAQGSNFNSQASFTTTTTQKPTAGLTHYTPTVPKISSTTPINKPVNRFDRNQYDDGSYDSRYDYTDNKDDEFLKTAHSQNIANSRNEYEKSLKQSTTQKYFEQTRGFTTSTENYPKNYPQATRNIQQRPVESAYKSTENNPKSTFQAQRNIHSTQQNTPAPQRNIQNGQKSQQNQNLPSIQNKKPISPKKPKDYDYAYYDSAIPDTEDYQIDTDIKKERRN